MFGKHVSKNKNEIIPFDMFKKLPRKFRKRKNDKTGKLPKIKCSNLKDKETMAKRENKDKK